LVRLHSLYKYRRMGSASMCRYNCLPEQLPHLHLCLNLHLDKHQSTVISQEYMRRWSNVTWQIPSSSFSRSNDSSRTSTKFSSSTMILFCFSVHVKQVT
jgi:hypothetical protein